MDRIRGVFSFHPQEDEEAIISDVTNCVVVKFFCSQINFSPLFHMVQELKALLYVLYLEYCCQFWYIS